MIASTDSSVTGSTYEFRVKDHLEEGWFRMFSGLHVKNVENGEVLIIGQFENQAAVHDILQRIQNLNLILISLKKVERSESA
jgi:hypothetical protein